MNIGQLKKLLEQFADDEPVLIGNYSEEDSEGNMPLHEIRGAEYVPITKGKKPVIAIYFEE